MIGIRYVPSRSFFDSDSVLEPVEKARGEFQAKAGAFVRRDAKGLIRPGKRPSAPGKPPHAHIGKLGGHIAFGTDDATGHMLIGPEKTTQSLPGGAGRPLTGPVPEILSEGGDIEVLEVWLPHRQRWVRASGRMLNSLAGRTTRLRRVHVAPRPFMGPALAKNVDKFPGLWADII